MRNARTPDARSRHTAIMRRQSLAFGAIRGLSLLTIAILGTILGFILWKGLRYSRIDRSDFLATAEAEPNGLVVAINSKRSLDDIDWTTLYGMFTDEYINWAKIDESDADMVPVAVDPSQADGAAAEAFLFGSEKEGGYPLWGGLVQFVGDAQKALAEVASTPGAVTVVPRSALGSLDNIKTLALRRLALAVNPEVVDFVDNSRLKDLSDADIMDVLKGKILNWKHLGGPDLAVTLIAPPTASPITPLAAKAGLRYESSAGAPDPATDDVLYAQDIMYTSGAAGLMYAGQAGIAGIPLATRTSRSSGWNLTLRYLFEAPRLSGRTGGISTIIANTFFMLLLTVLFAAPLGIAAAVYLVEYARQGRLIRLLRLGTETLAGIPSIIFGLFGFLFFVNILGFGFGLLSGSLTITLMILPTIIRTSEEALKSVPRSLREGSLALGASKLQTISRVVIPAATPGILTGLILAVGRAVGETAALLFTMGSDYQLAKGLFSSARGLSAHVYLLFSEGISFDRAFSTATVLVAVVLLFNFASKRVIGGMNRSGAA